MAHLMREIIPKYGHGPLYCKEAEEFKEHGTFYYSRKEYEGMVKTLMSQRVENATCDCGPSDESIRNARLGLGVNTLYICIHGKSNLNNFKVKRPEQKEMISEAEVRINKSTMHQQFSCFCDGGVKIYHDANGRCSGRGFHVKAFGLENLCKMSLQMERLIISTNELPEDCLAKTNFRLWKHELRPGFD